MHLLRRIILALLIVVAAAFLIWGPRPGGNFPKDRVVVDYWEKWVGNEAAQMQEIVNDFNNTEGKEKGIWVRYLSMSTIDEKMMVASAAGAPPDVAGLWDTELAPFASLGALTPLEDLAAQYGITEEMYKPVYWKECHYEGHLWALISTPAAVALHYNKDVFRQNAPALRRAGLDPDRPPRTLDELDRYAKVLTTFDGKGRILQAGYLPMEPGWYIVNTPLWFGGDLFDAATQKFSLLTPANLAAFQWIKKYSIALGPKSLTEFHSGLGGFDSAQNPFLVGALAMEQQGPWMANYIYNLAPAMSEVLVPRDREFSLPDRTANYAWAAAPFPAAIAGLENVTYCPADMLMIPRAAKHKKEAFEFIAYTQRQEVMEKLNMLHCKNSPLRKVSRNFLTRHPNPYISVFETLASSPNAHGIPQIPIWPEAVRTITDAAQSVYLLHQEPAAALRNAQERLQAKLDRYRQLHPAPPGEETRG